MLDRALATRIAAAAHAARPREHCAALLGKGGEAGDIFAHDCVRLLNSDGRPGRFAVADADLRHACRVADARGYAVVAWLHSHPGDATALSPDDAASLVHARLPWIIAACHDDGGTSFAAYAAGTTEAIPVFFSPGLGIAP